MSIGVYIAVLTFIQELRWFRSWTRRVSSTLLIAINVKQPQYSNCIKQSLDTQMRAAVSVARRLQDPLEELVKVEVDAIGRSLIE